jgi:acyl-CoA reductase-like NAD-dependent aldehyde dehydrogenase
MSARARTGKVQSTLKTSATVGGIDVPAVPTGLFVGGEWRDAANGETFDDVEDAVALANDTRYGLAAYVWTNDLSQAHRLAARVRAGSVWINGPGAPDARLPWGGLKTSGLGRELGWAGIEASTEEKTVTITL